MAKNKSLCTIKLDYDQADALMMAILEDAMRNAKADIKRNAKFAGPEAVEFVKACKIVLNYFSIGEPYK